MRRSTATRAVLAVSLLAGRRGAGRGSLDETIRSVGREVGAQPAHAGRPVRAASRRWPSRGTAGCWPGRAVATAWCRSTTPTTGAEVVRLVGHSAVVRGIAFAPDGRGLATGGDDRTIKLWDVPVYESSLSLSAKP